MCNEEARLQQRQQLKKTPVKKTAKRKTPTKKAAASESSDNYTRTRVARKDQKAGDCR